MSLTLGEPTNLVYKILGDAGRRYVVYNASVIGNPSDHLPDKWYVRPYPVPLGLAAGLPFDTPDEAERSVQAR